MLRPIRNKRDYQAALDRAYELLQLDPKVESELGDEYEVLTLLIDRYEEQHHPIPPPHPVDAIKFWLDQLGWKAADLQPILWQKSRVSDILSGKRKLSLEMIRKLHESLGIPLEILTARY